jgi:hypothetical protein
VERVELEAFLAREAVVRVVADVGRVVVDGARVAGHALSGRVALRVVADDVRPALGARLGPVLCVQRGVSDLVVTDYLALRRGVATSAEYRRLFAAATSPRNIQAFATASPRRVSTEYRQLFAAAATSPRNIQVLAAASPRRLHGISSFPPRRRRDLGTRLTTRLARRVFYRGDAAARAPVRVTMSSNVPKFCVV